MFEETDPEVCKVIIKVENTQFKCNRLVLSKHSPYFNAMFNGNFIEKNEKIVHIQQVKKSGFNNILKQIKDDSFAIKYVELLDTLQCACMLQFDEVKSHCVDRLTDNLPLEHSLQIWFETEALNIHPLSEKAKCKALIQFDEIRDTEVISTLDAKQLHAYLSNTLLYSEHELDVFEKGMLWWMQFIKTIKASPAKRIEIETKHLILVLNCIDFHSVTEMDLNFMLAFPGIESNTVACGILREMLTLVDNPDGRSSKQVDKQTKDLFYKPRKRNRTLLPCVVSSDFHGLNTKVDLNVSYYDDKNKCMQKVFDSHLHFESIGASSLTGAKFIEYQGNLFLYGGEFHYGTCNWNKDIWMYDTCRNKWEIVTKIPTERRHFKSFVIRDKLFIIGGTGKFRIRYNDDILYYDFCTREWTTDIKLPCSLTDVSMCNFKNNLFVMALNVFDCGFLYNTFTNDWQKMDMFDLLNLKPVCPEKFLLFSRGDSIFIKGSHLIELEEDDNHLNIKRYEKSKPIYGDEIDYFMNGDHLFLFSKHDATNQVIYTLHRYNIDNNEEELLIQVNDSVDSAWHIPFGCFPYFHHSVAKDTLSISDFQL